MWDLPDPFTIDVTVAGRTSIAWVTPTTRVYLRWCELCAWAHAEAVGVGWDRWEALDRAMVIRRSELDYLAPSHAGDAIRVANWVVQSDGRLRRRAASSSCGCATARRSCAASCTSFASRSRPESRVARRRSSRARTSCSTPSRKSLGDADRPKARAARARRGSGRSEARLRRFPTTLRAWPAARPARRGARARRPGSRTTPTFASAWWNALSTSMPSAQAMRVPASGVKASFSAVCS